MDSEWNHESRYGAIIQALYRLPHDQEPIGIGFKLRHSPTTCTRCRANIAAAEMRRIIEILENNEPAIGEYINRGDIVMIDGEIAEVTTTQKSSLP